MSKGFLLATAAFVAEPLFAQSSGSARAQQPVASAPQPPNDEDADEDSGQEITVTGARPPGSVVGNIPPENVLDPRDIRATGATSIAELLEAVAPQTGSARGRGGGAPVVLLNGQRISGFRELRDLPPEAIRRMEILPEEVALKYGYAADQKVVNIVLRRRFNSTAVELGGRMATDRGYAAGRANFGKLIIHEDVRTSGNLRLEGNNPLTESERAIALRPEDAIDSRPFRTLVGAGQSARLSATASRPLSAMFNGTLTGEAERRRGSSGLGLLDADPLRRRTNSDTLGIGGSLNGQLGRWRLSSTADADLVESDSKTALRGDLSKASRHSFAIDATAYGPLLALPAGTVNATFKAGASALGIDSRSLRAGVEQSAELVRKVLEASANVDLPLAERQSALGRLTANMNGGVRRLSDFGTLASVGAGLSWSPRPRLNLITSWTREQGAPSLQQLGDPLLETGGVLFFDAVRGEAVRVTTLTGGNPELDADRRDVLKIGGNWQLSETPDLRLRADFVRQTVRNPQINFPAATAALQAAFPSRFGRDATGRLVSVDLRPVNAERSVRQTLRWGFDLSRPLRTERPSAQTLNRLIERARQSGTAPGGRVAGGSAAPVAPPTASGDDTIVVRNGAVVSGGAAIGEGRGAGSFRPGGGGPFGSGRRGGRLTLSATHSLTLQDELAIGPGLPTLDYLRGEAQGASGGRPRHLVEVEGGYYNNGLGVRLSADWRSGTGLASADDDLRFSPYATFDLRAFANLGERRDLVTRVPFLRGSSIRLEVNNILNARPEVTGGAGAIPFAFQPDRLEPIGRTVGLTFRKLFIPLRFLSRGGQGSGGSRRGR